MTTNDSSTNRTVLTLKQYQWTTWWGGAALSDTPPQIHQKLIAIRKGVGGLKARKEATGPNFAVRKASDLMAKLRTALDKEDCHVYVVQQDVTITSPADIPPDAKGRVLRSAATVSTRVRVCAPDGSYIEAVGSGGGGDADDKAVGKASTYSYKDALIKALTLPDADIVDTDDDSEQGQVPELSAAAQTIIADVKDAAGDKARLRELRDSAKGLPLYEQRAVGAAIKEVLK